MKGLVIQIMITENKKLNKKLLFAKSFNMIGDSLNHCYDCKYCRLNGEKTEEKHYSILPDEVNDNFKNIPIAVNLFYGDPLLQVYNTVRYLRMLEKIGHK